MASNAAGSLDRDIAAAVRAVSARLAALREGDAPVTVRVVQGGRGDDVPLPARAVPLLLEVLAAIGEGRAVSVVAHDAELTTVQAARLLDVSRPYLIKLLDEGRLPYRRVGAHRRVRAAEVLAFKRASDADRSAALDRLAAQAQAEDMGYGAE